MLVAGVDENGLGPRLGPLVATSVVLELEHYRPAELARGGRRVGIDDSKAVSGFGQMAQAESVALALVERLHGRVPEDADDLLSLVALDAGALRAPCPSRSAPQCWREAVELPAFGGALDEGRRALDRLSRRGVEPRRARSAIACVRVFNDELSRLGSKLSVDLSLFEKLLLDAGEALREELIAICGMVGGIRRYRGYFDLLGEREVEVVEEIKGRSAYRVEGLGEIAFEVGADENHLPVALASMLGKYLRELAVERQNRFYRAHAPELPRASGYHDPVTSRFVEESEPLRRRLRIADRCFSRAR